MEREKQVAAGRIISAAQHEIGAARADLQRLGRTALWQLVSMLDAEIASLREDLYRDDRAVRSWNETGEAGRVRYSEMEG